MRMSLRRHCVGLAAALIVFAVAAIGAGTLAGTAGHSPDPGRAASPTAAAGAHLRPAPAATGKAPGAAGSPAPPRAASLLAPAGRYVGVAMPGGVSALPEFTAATGTRPDISELFTNLGSPFPAAAAELDLEDGAYTLISWMSQTQSLAQIAAGADDDALRSFAAAAKAFAWPVLIDFDHEFNGDWYPWGTQSASAGQFVAAWRHIHDVFTAVGASNVLWIWSPNVVNPVPDVELSAYWPGSHYVDIVGIVGYYTGKLGEDSYRDLFTRTENVIDTFAAKPFLITEVGAAQGPDKAGWITDLLQGVGADPRMLGLVYFDQGDAQGKRADWTIEDSPTAVAAWRTAVAKLSITVLPGSAP